jgi:phosphate transport system substrate-binding protein
MNDKFTFSLFIAISLIFALLGSFLFISPSVNAGEKKTLTWAGCGITKKAFMAELAAAFEKKTGTKILLQGGGATRGIRYTAEGKTDMGGTCRMTLPELDSTEWNVNLHPVAWDALAVILHKDNSVDNISEEQIRKIYTGKIKNWKQLDGADAPIHLYVRKGKTSGVGYTVRQYIFRDSTVDFVTDENYIVKSSGPLEKAVEKDPYAMGITGISSARKRNVKIVGINGYVPSFENVRDGKYTLYRPLYLVTGSNPSKEVMDFIKFAQSKEGRKVIRANGTVPYLDALHLMSKMVIYGFGVK